MPAALKKRSSMHTKHSEGKAHEMKEFPEDEIREGGESEDGEYGKTNRKRSHRGAKHTKAPMDAEGCACEGKGRKGKAACDGDCGMKRGDAALTAPEYLAACDLGIQDRSRSYIRTRLTVMDSLTPGTVQLRTDAGSRKCGNSYIPANKQCRAGAGGGMGRKIATGAAIAGGVAAAAYGVSRMRRGGASSSAIVPYRGGGGRMPSNLSRNSVGNRARRAAYNAGSAVRGAATNLVEGRRSGSFTSAGSIGNRVRRLRNSNIPRSAGMAARRAGQGFQSAANSARFATRRGAGFTAGNSLGNTARRAVYGGSMAARRGAARMSARRPRSVTGGLALRRRGDDDVWAVGFEPTYA
jgi:hypothetical protein